MRSVIALAAFVVCVTLVGVYENWEKVGSAAWWTSAAGGTILAALHGVTRHAGRALGVLGLLLLAIAMVHPSLFEGYDRSLFNGLACGFMAGIAGVYAIKKLAAARGGGR